MANILLTHNFYQQQGGEDLVFESEGKLLSQHGHTVVRFTQDNRAIESMAKPALLHRTLWNGEVARKVKSIIRAEKIDLVHSHNTFPLISPSIYSAASEAGVPVVQTIHNYRLICAAATLSRNGQPCEKCNTSGSMIPAVVHRCYHSSALATIALTGMLRAHRALGTWNRRITRYIALTEFMKRKLIEGGLPAEKIAVKPNFCSDEYRPRRDPGRFALFVGRLSHEKGLNVLLDAWSRQSPLPLKIAGSGPEESWAAARTRDLPQVQLLGRQTNQQRLELMREAYCLIVPSIWFEGFPMVVIEAYAAGLPVCVCLGMEVFRRLSQTASQAYTFILAMPTTLQPRSAGWCTTPTWRFGWVPQLGRNMNRSSQPSRTIECFNRSTMKFVKTTLRLSSTAAASNS